MGGKEINYLDMNIKESERKFEFNIYRKKTYTDLIILIIPNELYQSMKHKIKTLARNNNYNI